MKDYYNDDLYFFLKLLIQASAFILSGDLCVLNLVWPEKSSF